MTELEESEGLSTPKKVAAGAAIGAVAAVAIPTGSIGVGALVGAGVAAYRRLGRKP